jgi:hypothetical protein
VGHDEGPPYVSAEVSEILKMQVSENHKRRQAQPEILLYQEHHEDNKIDEVKKDQAE